MIFVKKHNKLGQAGATIVEVLVAIALTGIFMPALATALVAAHAGRASSVQQLQAQSLLREASEAVRNIREKGWTNVATDGTYHPVAGASDWSLASGSETINGFTRQVVISTPQRNGSGTIVGSGGTNDPSTKHVVITVSWAKPTSGSLSTDAYLSRWQTNTVWTQTLAADFNGGTLTNTCATSTCTTGLGTDTIQLQDSPATWQLPSFIGGYNISGSVAGNDVFIATISGTQYAFVGDVNALLIINITNPAAPTLTGSLAMPAAVNGVFVSGTVAYLATANPNGQLTTVNVANPAAPVLLRAFQITDTNNVAATGVYVNGTTAYVVKNQVGKALLFNTYGEINSINVTNPSSPTLNNALNITGSCTGIWVSGTYAYVTTSLSTKQLTVVNISNPSNLTSAATVSLGVTANDVVINGTTAYIGTINNTGGGEVRIYNVATPTAPASLGSYEVGADVKGVGIDSTNANYLVLATASTTKESTIINVSTPATPTLVSSVDLSATPNKVFVLGRYAYYGSLDTVDELTIVYTGFRPSGTFESSTFDPGANVGYNYFAFTHTVPAGTTLKYQIAANNTNSGWSYVGPDGTASTYYTSPGSIPLNFVSNRYFRYKATFTPSANGQLTPSISDVEVNYSP